MPHSVGYTNSGDMQDNIKFQMSDGLVIKGAIMGDVTSKHLIIFLHSGGYNRHDLV